MPYHMQNYIEHLQQQIALTPDEIELIKANLIVKQFSKNEFILEEGDYSEEYFFVEQGVIRSYTIDENGKEHIVQFATENWIISDRNSTLCKKTAKFYIQAIEDSTIIILNDEMAKFIASLNPDYIQAQLSLVQNHVRHLQDRIILLLSATAKTRYQEFIKLYPKQINRIPQWMIASYLGITPESLSRVRKEIATHG